MSVPLPFYKRRVFRLHSATWLALVLLGVSIFSLYFPLRLVLIHAVSNVALVAILFYGTAALVNIFFEKGKTLVAVLLGGLAFLGISGLRIAVNLALLEGFSGATTSPALISPVLRVAALVLATSAFIMLFGASYQLLDNRYRKERHTQALLQEQQAAQLDFLKAQINPHFLFNALNNIYSLTVLQSPEAPKMLLKLSDLLRYVIYDGQKKAVALQKEVQHLNNFIELFQMRNEHPVDITFTFNGDLSGRYIEPMILIPILENCFKHTDFELNEHAFAHVQLQVAPGRLLFATQNTFDPNNKQKDDTGGVGLENIRRRLALRYADAYTFEAAPKDQVFEVRLAIETMSDVGFQMSEGGGA